MTKNYDSPPPDCSLCPRLCAFRAENRIKFPSYHNAPVPSFGELDAELLIVGLAPGLHGANQTGRPFTGDYAGIILYSSLLKFGLAKGNYLARLPLSLRGRVGVGGSEESDLCSVTPPSNSLPQGGGEFCLINTRITNAVRCVPQENKPEPSEIKTCNGFLKAEIAAMPNLKAILSLGLVSHNAVLKAFGLKPSAAKFSHGAVHIVDRGQEAVDKNKNVHNPLSTVHLFNSYHCSRYNINTGRLNQEMFDEIIKNITLSVIPKAS